VFIVGRRLREQAIEIKNDKVKEAEVLEDFKEILKTEFSERFVQLMKNRMIVSYYKYGKLKDNAKKELGFNPIKDLKKRLEMYEMSGNTEWLVDVANFAMIEFMFPTHEKAHFRPTTSEESPGVSGLTIKEIEELNKKNFGKE